LATVNCQRSEIGLRRAPKPAPWSRCRAEGGRFADDIVMPLLGSDRSVEVTVSGMSYTVRPGAKIEAGIVVSGAGLAQQSRDKVPRTIMLGDNG
jgi:hypothetical protein